MRTGPLWISEEDVEALVDPAALIAAVERGFAEAETGMIREAPSSRMDGLDGGDAYLTVYPAHGVDGMASAKVLAGRPRNATENRTEIDAVVALVEPATGRIASLVAARSLTALRTAAATAAVLRRLLDRGAARIAMVGTGGQAAAHGRMLAAAGLACGFTVVSPRGDLGRAEAAAWRIASASGVPAEAGPWSAIAGCDAVVCMTLARRPQDLGALPQDVVVASIGPFYPGRQEIDPAVVAAAALVVSDYPDRLRRQWAGSPLLHVDALPLVSAAELLSDRARPPFRGRRVFLSDGRGFQDNVAATMIHDAAIAAGRGLRLP